MGDALVVSDTVADGVRRVHLMQYGSPPAWPPAGIPAGTCGAKEPPISECGNGGERADVRRWQDADVSSIHHVEVSWGVCGMVTADFHLDGYLVARRRLAEVGLKRGALREVVREGMFMYMDAQRCIPGYAWVREMPPFMVEFKDEVFGNTRITVLTAEWVPPGVAMLGSGGGAVRPAVYVGVDKPYMEVRRE